MISRNAPDERTSPRSTQRTRGGTTAAHREDLVAEMVRRAVLPRLLARKDNGAFDRGPNVVRFPNGEEA